jgi:hypothetical protein
MCWAGLKWQDRGLSVERVGDLAGEFVRDGGSINDILSLCIETAVKQGALGRPEMPEQVTERALEPAADQPASESVSPPSTSGTSDSPNNS